MKRVLPLISFSIVFFLSCGGGGQNLSPVFSPPLGEPSPIVRGVFDLQSSSCRTDDSQLVITQNVQKVWMKGGFDYGEELFTGGWENSGMVDSENVVRFFIDGKEDTLTCIATLLEPIFQGTCEPASGEACDFVFSRAEEEKEEGGIEEKTFEEIDSPEEFQKTTEAVGDAEGSLYSGTYAINRSGLSYSDDCTAVFILTTDFFVNTALSVEEVEDLIRTGTEARSGILTVIQDDGSLTFAGVGDDGANEKGALYSDGRFRIVYGIYSDEDNYFWSAYEGQFRSGGFDATFESHIKLETEDLRGSCSVEGSLSGEAK